MNIKVSQVWRADGKDWEIVDSTEDEEWFRAVCYATGESFSFNPREDDPFENCGASLVNSEEEPFDGVL